MACACEGVSNLGNSTSKNGRDWSHISIMSAASGDEHQAKDALKRFYGDKRKKRTKESRVSIL